MDAIRPYSLPFQAMRRHVYDPLEPTKEPRCYAVRNMYGAVLEARQLPPGADVKRAFAAAMLEWIDAGWQLGEFSSRTGVFFAQRGIERRQIEITPSDHGRARGWAPERSSSAAGPQCADVIDAVLTYTPAERRSSSRIKLSAMRMSVATMSFSSFRYSIRTPTSRTTFAP